MLVAQCEPTPDDVQNIPKQCESTHCDCKQCHCSARSQCDIITPTTTIEQDCDDDRDRSERENHHHGHGAPLCKNAIDVISVLNDSIKCHQLELAVDVDGNDLGKIRPLLTNNLCVDGTSITGEKFAIESLMFRLYDNEIGFTVDYNRFKNDFTKNPGLVVFIKNFSPELVCDVSILDAKPVIIHDKENKFFEYLNSNTYFKSLAEIKLFVRLNSPPFCLVKLDNHLDVDFLIKNISLQPNKFNHNENIPLYANRYINKPYNNGNFICDTLLLTNLSHFFPPDLPLNKFQHFINLFARLSPVDSIYFPIANGSFSIGYIKFKKVPNITEIGLKILLAFNGLTWPEISKYKLDEINEFVNKDHPDVNEDHTHGLGVNIAQQKHNHYLLKYANCPYISLPFTICYPNPWLQVGLFAKTTSYQETNIYVINVAQLFHDDDELWCKFWRQFGDITSAKIINREGGKNINDSNRQIGFVFYKEFRLAIRAILHTNNKLITIPDMPSFLIQSSFALQKQTYQLQGIKYYQEGFVPPLPLLLLHGYPIHTELNQIFADMDMWLGCQPIPK
jgi:hypothetical protein